ncbi:dienelactone hydrolase family protein [Mycolicibacterium fortuitum]|uniref:Dienelactone hydrolase family protein n=2 Tax=Mycolicibacterium fortuitum TaxID=1766 RepID=A0AAE4VFU9_MYCFO|nr:dienelactone hydrolase family protein [Mycolicibacterium fortuitum]MDV7193685.1 dienelactone hydrolase family protein [Mycolicibacterium fortuitum]MDV7207094.1 dienelactone hydrolase family protein [Mycolicibacterium fortuitum]MDV7228605.1 dienelactone hydrolase family protein [Mycolicibacterium fortuitum]MDV7260631.1 dienelactone hydrolase family protein [Mycolicibacterium fortuitum]MDV7285548.1 dienelactone hydrolase family protein [Mycolicibacterium fortuitum]
MPNISYPAPAGDLPGYLAIPTGEGPWPGVVVIQDVQGMTADLRRISDRLASEGYLTLAPHLYGRGFKPRCMIATIRAHFADTGVAYDDITAAREYLVGDPRCNGRIGLIGFCMGAGFVLQLSPRGLFDVAAAQYGLAPKNIEKLARSCPVVASYGAKDRIVKQGSASALESVLTQGRVDHDVKEYPDAGHSFMNKSGIPAPFTIIETLAGFSYSQPEAEDAWNRTLAFFAKYLTQTPDPSGLSEQNGANDASTN